MIDWWGLVSNSIWILGLSVCLATLSLVSYRARAEQIPLREAVNEPGSQLALAIGLLFFCLGILATSRTWWQVLVSSLLVLLIAGQIHRHWRQRRHDSS
jgi:hypothetical protein